jgi:hypothetical protein
VLHPAPFPMFYHNKPMFFPFSRILKYSLFEAHTITGMAHIYYFYNSFLILLLVLSAIWFYFIGRTAYLAIRYGKVDTLS